MTCLVLRSLCSCICDRVCKRVCVVVLSIEVSVGTSALDAVKEVVPCGVLVDGREVSMGGQLEGIRRCVWVCAWVCVHVCMCVCVKEERKRKLN